MPNTTNTEALPATSVDVNIRQSTPMQITSTPTLYQPIGTMFNTTIAGVCILPQCGIVQVSGADASAFLHSQLTNDIKSLPSDHARLAGYCTPKGRLMASMLVWKAHETLFLQLPIELLSAFQKRLHLFIMRSKVTLSNVTETTPILGIIGTSVAAQLSPWFPQLPDVPYQFVSTAAGTLLRVADALGIPRYQWIATTEQAATELRIAMRDFPTLSPAQWDWTEIRAGIPHITQATQEKFVPQMVNYDLINAVNFKKGCYPGQEIVARSQYLGSHKRRMVLARIDTEHVKAGDELIASNDPDQPCGMVVNAQATGANQSDCLIVIKTAITDAFLPSISSERPPAYTVHLASGEICQWQSLPYSVVVDQ